ncbi:hypothetical protein [Trichocoleus sp. DQ-U1]|uniref:hypothetical protein n=1 Tax=Trichocoleus sp. DQ-U1 TaxID=2933926 RepID=UPI0032984838
MDRLRLLGSKIGLGAKTRRSYLHHCIPASRCGEPKGVLWGYPFLQELLKSRDFLTYR